jgi:TolA-binding protein
LRSWSVLLAVVLLSSACSTAKPTPAPSRTSQRAARESVTEREAELDKRIARLELRLLEKEAQLEEFQARLEDARAEVVRAMAKLQTVASRAEAASGMAEAEVALQSLKSSARLQPLEAAQVTRLVRQSSAEFDKQNYGGALYLATQAKTLASAYSGRLADDNRGGSRAGETPFALPIPLKVASRGNVREGPGTNFAVAFAVDAGVALTGHAYTDEWIRISDDGGRSGWIFRALVARP